MSVVSRLNSDNSDLVRTQDNIKRVLDPVLANKLLAGTLVQSVTCVGGTQLQVNHGLGRPPIGYFVTRVQGANQILIREASSQPNPTAFLLMVPSATGTVDLWVY